MGRRGVDWGRRLIDERFVWKGSSRSRCFHFNEDDGMLTVAICEFDGDDGIITVAIFDFDGRILNGLKGHVSFSKMMQRVSYVYTRYVSGSC